MKDRRFPVSGFWDSLAFIGFVYGAFLSVSQLGFSHVDVRHFLAGCCPFSHALYFVLRSRLLCSFFTLAGVAGVYLLLPSRAALLVLLFPVFQQCIVANLTEPLFLAMVFFYLRHPHTPRGFLAWAVACGVRINALPLILARHPIPAAWSLLPVYVFMLHDRGSWEWVRYFTPSLLLVFSELSRTSRFYPLLVLELYQTPEVWANIHHGLEVMT